MESTRGDQREGMEPEACESAAGRGASGAPALATPPACSPDGGPMGVWQPAAAGPSGGAIGLHGSSFRSTSFQRARSNAASRQSRVHIRPTAARAQGAWFFSVFIVSFLSSLLPAPSQVGPAGSPLGRHLPSAGGELVWVHLRGR